MASGTGAPPPSLYAQTITVVRGIAPVLLAGAGVIALSGIVPDMPILRSLTFLVATLAGAVVAHAACLFVLSGGAVAGSDALALTRSGPGILFVMAWMLPPLLLFLFETVMREGVGVGEDTLVLLAFLDGLVFLFLLARYGTVYPAILDGADPSLAAAGGRVPTGAVFWRLFGASLFGVAVLFGLLVFFFILDTVTPPGTGFALGVVMRLATYACVLSVFVAIVVVLCNAYRGAYGGMRPG